jgi:YidC/Oxa1 family membrane protein insertase
VDRLQIAAIVLAAALVGAALFFRPVAPAQVERPVPAPMASETPEKSPPAPTAPAPTRVIPAETRAPEKLLTLHNDAVEIRVSSVGLRVDGIELPQYKATTDANSGPVELATSPSYGAMKLFMGPEPLKSLELQPAEVTVSEPQRVELRAVSGGVAVTRRLELDDSGYGGRLVVKIENGSSAPIQPALELVFYGQERAADAADHFPKYSVIASVDGSIHRTPVQGIGSTGIWGSLLGKGPPTKVDYPAPVDWAGVDSQYFLLAAAPQNAQESSAILGPLGVELGFSAVQQKAFELPPGLSLERSYRLYFGPKIEDAVVAVDPKLATAIDAGWAWVRPLVMAFGGLLRWTHDHVIPNYGVAIILLTILVRVLTYPLTARQMASMKRFSSIAPQMKEIQEKYASDREKMQAELSKVYSQTGVSPLTAMGGCLPMVIQMPVMFALYFALQTSIELRHAPFMLWINDLSAPEHFFSIGGIPIRLLPLLMGGSMLLQQRLTPAPNADPQQRQMMTLMSVMFTFMFYQFPAGLVLYWFVSNLLGIAQQLLVNRNPAPATATTSEKPA